MQRSRITAFKIDERVIASHWPNNWEIRDRNLHCFRRGFAFPRPLPSWSLKNISSLLIFAYYILTLSQLAGISYHRAIDWTQRTILRDQRHGPSTVLKHTVFTEEPRPMKHYNTLKDNFRILQPRTYFPIYVCVKLTSGDSYFWNWSSIAGECSSWQMLNKPQVSKWGWATSI